MLTSLEVYSALPTAPDVPLVLGNREDTDPIHIRGIDGLGPVKANIATTPYGAADGVYSSGATVPERSIILKVGFNPDWVNDTVATLRDKLYQYFMPKRGVRLRFFRDNGPTVEIAGIVEDCTPNIFSKDPEMQISILCPEPDFIAVATSHVDGFASATPEGISFTALSNVDRVPFTIDIRKKTGGGDYSGLITVQRPDFEDGKAFQVTGSVDDSSEVIIDSAFGNKKATNMIMGVSDGDINLLNTMTDASEWLYITPGTNVIRVILEDGAEELAWIVQFNERFGGL